MGGFAEHHFPHQFAGSRRHAQTQHVMTGGNPDVVHGWASIDDRFTIPRHGPPAKPLFFDRFTIWVVQIMGR